MIRPIYYLPGAHGRLESGLGVGLIERGLRVYGRATVDEFRQYAFDDQTALIRSDLRAPEWWNSSSLVITNSYGSYLFLNAQLHMPSFPGRVLMLSPILGSFESTERAQTFVPPYADRLMKAVRDGIFPKLDQLEVHVGSEDWQSPPGLTCEFAKLIGASVTIAAGRGHMLGKDYVGPVLDRWLSNSPEHAAFNAYERSIRGL